MSINISKPQQGPPIITLFGDAGTGKTSLAGTFEKPIFIRGEDGMQAFNAANMPDAFDVIKSSDDLWEQCMHLIHEDHNYKTLVIDTVTSLETIFINEIIEGDPKKPKGLNQSLGGYGNGTDAVAALHFRLRKAADILNTKKGMTIVFVAHTDIVTIDLPDAEPYSKYNIRIGKKGYAAYTDLADIVGLIRLGFVTNDKNKAISTGDRVIQCQATASSISKNRYRIKKDITFDEGVNPLIPFIPYFNKTKGETK